MSVVAVCQEAFGGSVPARGNVLRVGLLGVDATAAAKVCQLETLIYDQDVLRLDVPAACKQLKANEINTPQNEKQARQAWISTALHTWHVLWLLQHAAVSASTHSG